MPHGSAIEIQHDGEWFVGWSPDTPGANGQGRTLEACLAGIAAALEMMLEVRKIDSLAVRYGSILRASEGGLKMAVATDFIMAQSFLTQNDGAAKVFKFILQKSAAPGWQIVKELGQDTDQTEDSLLKLKSLGLLEGDGNGLDGFYNSTSLGYAVREALSIY